MGHHLSTLKVDRCYKELVRLPLRYDDIKRVEVKFLLGTVIILLAFKAVLVEHTSLDGDGFSRPRAVVIARQRALGADVLACDGIGEGHNQVELADVHKRRQSTTKLHLGVVVHRDFGFANLVAEASARDFTAKAVVVLHLALLVPTQSAHTLEDGGVGVGVASQSWRCDLYH